jgi:hypothetical protein
MPQKSFAVLHVKKISGSGAGGIGSHISRKHTPANADPERIHLNQELVKSRSNSLKQDIDERIREGYTSKRKIRTDAVRAVGVILSGSPEEMKKIEKDGRLDEWCQANKKFVQERFGKDNVLRCTLHMDERTPHLHAVFTPITKDGKLHFKSFIDGKKGLTRLQDEYAKEMANFGLKRGLKQSVARHTTTREYYARLEAVPPVAIQKNMLGQPKNGEEERLTDEFKKITAAALTREAETARYWGAMQQTTRQNKTLKELLEREKSDHKRTENLLIKIGKGDQTTLRAIERAVQKDAPKQHKGRNQGPQIG